MDPFPSLLSRENSDSFAVLNIMSGKLDEIQKEFGTLPVRGLLNVGVEFGHEFVNTVHVYVLFSCPKVEEANVHLILAV